MKEIKRKVEKSKNDHFPFQEITCFRDVSESMMKIEIDNEYLFIFRERELYDLSSEKRWDRWNERKRVLNKTIKRLCLLRILEKVEKTEQVENALN